MELTEEQLAQQQTAIQAEISQFLSRHSALIGESIKLYYELVKLRDAAYVKGYGTDGLREIKDENILPTGFSFYSAEQLQKSLTAINSLISAANPLLPSLAVVARSLN